MAGTPGQTSDTLVQRLTESPYSFDFFQAVRLLESLRTDMPRVGYSVLPAQDAIRFGQKPSLAFAPSTIEQCEAVAGRFKLFVRFLGLMGPNAPLPPHLTDYVRDRRFNEGDSTLSAFLDVFHHRLIAMFYRAWAVHQKATDLDRPGESRFVAYIGSLCGLGLESMRNRDEVADWSKIHFAGRLACEPRNAQGLEGILQAYYDIPTEVQSMMGRWLQLPPDARCQLGRSAHAGTLGTDAILGGRIWDCQLSFRVRMGPMGLADYQRMLPSESSFERLRCWVKNYVGEQYYWDLQLVLKAEEVPGVCLGRAGRLGWTSWLHARPGNRDRDDIVINGSRLN